MTGALFTDLYELNMAASYLRRDMDGPRHLQPVRPLAPSRARVPRGSGPRRAASTSSSSFAFDDDDLRYLGSIGFDDRALEDFAGLRFDGSVRAVAEGRVVHGDEPILEVTAPIPVAQLVETYLLNQITPPHDDRLEGGPVRGRGRRPRPRGLRVPSHARRGGGASGRSRHRHRGLRRDLERGSGTRARACSVAGTMAHSFIEAFASEDEAFRAFAQDHPRPDDVPRGHLRHAATACGSRSRWHVRSA